MTFTEGQPTPVQCHVGSAMPAPRVNIKVGHPAHGFRDLTALFHRKTEANIYCKETMGSGDKTCPLNMDLSTRLSVSAWEPNFLDNRRSLICEASYPEDLKLKGISTEVKIEYECKINL